MTTKKVDKEMKIIKIIIIVLNIIGILCLLYFAIPYLKHDMSTNNPNSMLVFYTWDICGLALSLGIIPLAIVNALAFFFIKFKKKLLGLLFFIPTLICFILVAHYLLIATDWKEEKVKDPISVIRCVKDEKVYVYKVYKEDDSTYALGLEEDDILPLSVVDYSNEDTILESIEKYYKDNGGMCP